MGTTGPILMKIGEIEMILAGHADFETPGGRVITISENAGSSPPGF